MFNQSIQINPQITHQNQLHAIANQFNLLNQIAKQIQQTQIQSTLQLAHRLKNIITIMQQRFIFILEGKQSNQFHDYVVQFYEHQINLVHQELQMLRQEKQKHLNLIHQLQANNHINQFQTHQNKDSQINDIMRQINLQAQLTNLKQLLYQNQQFTKEQNTLIQNLKQNLNYYKQKQSKTTLLLQQKFNNLDIQINKNNADFNIYIQNLDQQRKLLYSQIKQLELLNLKYLEQRDQINQQLVLKNQEYKIQLRKNFDLNLEYINNKKSPSYKIRKEQKQNLLQMQLQAIKNKCQLIERQWKIKFQKKTNVIAQLEEKVHQLQNKNLSLIKQADQSQFQLQRQQANKINFQSKYLQEVNTTQKLMKQLMISQNQKRLIEEQKKSHLLKLKQYQKLFDCSEKYQINTQQKIKKMSEIIINLNKKHEQQKQEFKKQITKQIQNLIKENQNLQSIIKYHQSQIKQYIIITQKLKQTNNYLEQKNKKTQVDYKNSLIKIQQSIDEKNKLRAINQQLKSQIQKVKQQKNNMYQSSLSSFQVQKQQVNNLQVVLASKNKNIQQKQEQINKLLMENKTLKQKINGTQKQQDNNFYIQKLRNQINKKDFEIRQLQSKLAIVQQELRQTDKTNSMQRIRMQEKIKQLQVLLSERYSFSSR